MLRPVPMVHFRVQVPNKDAARVARRIAEEGVLHLVDIAHGRVPGDGVPEGAADLLDAYRGLARKLREVAARLEVPLPEPVGALEARPAEDLAVERTRLEAEVGALHHEVGALWRRREAAREAAARAADAEGHGRRLAEADVDPRRLAATRFGTVRLGLADEADLQGLVGLLAPLPVAVVPLDARPTPLVAVAVPRSGADRLEEVLRVVPFESVSAGAEGPLSPEGLAARRRESEAEVAAAEAALAALREEVGPTLPDRIRRVDLGVLILQALLRFAAAGRFTVITGWVPEESALRLQRSLARATDGGAVVDVERPENLPEVAAGRLGVPILHRNPLLLRPFQRLVGLYGTPSYGEMEPTPFFAVSLLLMFGLMFGDVGHGLVLFLGGWLTFRYLPRFLDYGVLLMEAGTASVVFGFLYGSFFGIEGLLPVLWMEPLHELHRFMAVAIAFGVVLVSVGLVLGVVNAWRSGERARALFGTHGLFGATLYWIVLVLVVRALVPETLVLPGWALVAMGAVPVVLLLARPFVVRRLGGVGRRPRHVAGPRWLAALEGTVDVVDTVFAFFANTVSFVRIAAFAAVHAGILVALFAIADTLAEARFGGPLSVLALVVGNAVVILLEGLTVTVQVLRLEYYEFFSHFFRGGGEPYRPLSMGRPADEGGGP